ncbi:bifunctional molybdenum cofactor biosynthesis protein MoaC/MoaB [Acinetobacter larvae]|uniref:Bifunctional molybdenum cofactor biosynthesis protein MoaC/MoaB n=1 Tax=Acinetobacter larvae TaxID=1789224 RepID=A0A1B2M072_9GAMM|nr:bifunctional molybdenum cofactor biosynthesis protein MoaC/MoaB [Acinetobacter larvae]AOA58580.1 bifunctional molybdenum cofactor biosynthesis protein MoaC/MoaB [Acinetobacter larvae]
MKNITMKPESYRMAQASSSVLAPAHCLALLAEGKTEKGDALKTARIAGILAAKRTDELIPLCHPLPIHAAEVTFELLTDRVVIHATVETIAATGVEMEALTAASLAALTIYDMLKPHCSAHELSIAACQLDLKTGGKSSFSRKLHRKIAAAVIVLSDRVAAGKKTDTAGQSIVSCLEETGFSPIHYQIIADDSEILKQLITQLTSRYACIITVGGTGIGQRDITVETVQPLLQQELHGLMEAARAFGQKRTPYAALSRGVAGFIDQALLLTLPGSRRGASETMAAILPALIHIFAVRGNLPHGGDYQ